MTDRKGSNSFFKIHDHLRMLNDLIPANEGVLYRFLVNARLEVDENSGTILPRRGMSARQWLQLVSKIKRDTSFREASAKAGKLGLFKGYRIYSRGERQKGGDHMELDRSKWDDLTVTYLEGRDADLNSDHKETTKIPETGIQADPSKIPETGIQTHPETGIQGHPETGIQHNKETAIVTAKTTARKRTNFTGAPLDASSDAAQPKVASSNSSPLPPSLSELQEQQIDAELLLQQDIPWVDPARVSPKHAFGVWFDALAGKLFLINDERGKAVYRSLRDDNITPRQVAAGIGLACGAAGQRSARNGGHVGLVRQWCLIAKEREERQGRPNGGGYVKADAAPRSFGVWK